VTGHPEPDRAQLAADYAPVWQVFRRDDVPEPYVCAWLTPALPPIVLRDRTVAGLRARLETFGSVLYETGSLNRAEAAAEGGSDVR
jgi:hypothetical protein